MARQSCFALAFLAPSLALPIMGKSMAIRIEMIAMTVSSSMRVKAERAATEELFMWRKVLVTRGRRRARPIVRRERAKTSYFYRNAARRYIDNKAPPARRLRRERRSASPQTAVAGAHAIIFIRLKGRAFNS